MKSCKKAKESLKETGLEILATAMTYGWMTNDLSIRSIANTSWNLAKYRVKNDKEVQRNIGTYISCFLNL